MRVIRNWRRRCKIRLSEPSRLASELTEHPKAIISSKRECFISLFVSFNLLYLLCYILLIKISLSHCYFYCKVKLDYCKPAAHPYFGLAFGTSRGHSSFGITLCNSTLPLNQLEIRFRITGPAVRLDSKKPKGKKNDERTQKNWTKPRWDLNLHPNFPQQKKVRPLTTGLCNHCVNCSWKLIVLKYLFLLFTLLNLMELYLSWIQRYIWGK